MNRRQAFRSMLSYAKPHRYTFLLIFLFSIIAIFADFIAALSGQRFA